MTAVIFTETEFLSRDLLHPYKDEMVEYYFTNLEQNPSDYSCTYTNDVIEANIIPRIKEVLKKTFKVTVENIMCYIYIQNDHYCRPHFHHHVSCKPQILNATMTASLYLDPPEVGGEFQLMPKTIQPETYEDELKEYTFDVKENKLYFFPSWWMHRPLPQEDKTYRVCVSFDIFSFDRPVFLPNTPENVIW